MGKIISLFLFLIALICSSCGSKVPIADVSQAIEDDKIVGKWANYEKMPSEKVEVSVFKFNEKEYLAWLESEEQDSTEVKKESGFYRVYIVQIANKHFINAQDIIPLDPDERLYYFFTYEFKSDSILTLSSLKDVDSTKVSEFETSEDLFRFIKENLNNDSLYDDPVEFTKIKDF